jgi:threonine dehydrogenase-like Zn-dependent dehydrogenase
LVGLLPLADGTIGTALDVAGEIVKVGKGVQRFKAGDKVVAVLSFLVSAHFIPCRTRRRSSLSSSISHTKIHVFVILPVDRLEVDWPSML